jgi:hypothetical protein
MSNAYIYIAPTSIGLTFFPLIAFFAISVFFALADNFLATPGFRRWFHGICGDRSRCLPLNAGEDIGDCLRRRGRLNGLSLRQWRDLDHDAAPQENRKLFFTIDKLYLHAANEGSVKHFMFKWNYDRNKSTLDEKRIALCEGEVG